MFVSYCLSVLNFDVIGIFGAIFVFLMTVLCQYMIKGKVVAIKVTVPILPLYHPVIGVFHTILYDDVTS